MAESPRILVGASIPRSGHHFLERTLAKYFGRDIHYCEFYAPKDCCRQVPCTKRGGFRVIFQKNHDHHLTLDTALPGVTYVVQFRHPVPEAASDWELVVRDTPNSAGYRYRDTREFYAWWLANKAVYYRRFHDKWVASPPARAVLLDYDTLKGDPLGRVGDVIRAAADEVDEARLAAALADSSRIRATTGRPYTPRQVDASSFAHPGLVAAFEDYVLSHGPAYGYRPMLGGGYAGSELQGLILALDPGEPLPQPGQDRLALAMELSRGHPEVRLRLAHRHHQQGRPAEAAALLEALVTEHPHLLAAWQPLLRAWRDAGIKPRREVLSAEAVFAGARDPELLLALGRTWLESGWTFAALVSAQVAMAFHQADSRVRTLFAQALERSGRRGDALTQAKIALERDPADATAAAIVARLEPKAAPRA